MLIIASTVIRTTIIITIGMMMEAKLMIRKMILLNIRIAPLFTTIAISNNNNSNNKNTMNTNNNTTDNNKK